MDYNADNFADCDFCYSCATIEYGMDPNITHVHFIRSFSIGAPLMPSGGSFCSLLKSTFNKRRLAGVVILPFYDSCAELAWGASLRFPWCVCTIMIMLHLVLHKEQYDPNAALARPVMCVYMATRILSLTLNGCYVQRKTRTRCDNKGGGGSSSVQSKLLLTLIASPSEEY